MTKEYDKARKVYLDASAKLASGANNAGECILARRAYLDAKLACTTCGGSGRVPAIVKGLTCNCPDCRG